MDDVPLCFCHAAFLLNNEAEAGFDDGVDNRDEYAKDDAEENDSAGLFGDSRLRRPDNLLELRFHPFEKAAFFLFGLFLRSFFFQLFCHGGSFRLFALSVDGVLPAEGAVLLGLHTIGMVFLFLRRIVVSLLAFGAG